MHRTLGETIAHAKHIPKITDGIIIVPIGTFKIITRINRVRMDTMGVATIGRPIDKTVMADLRIKAKETGQTKGRTKTIPLPNITTIDETIIQIMADHRIRVTHAHRIIAHL